MKNAIKYRHPLTNVTVGFFPQHPDATSEVFWPHETGCVKVIDLEGALELDADEVTDILWVTHAKAANICGNLKRRGFIRV